jgi:hypothetical protein
MLVVGLELGGRPPGFAMMKNRPAGTPSSGGGWCEDRVDPLPWVRRARARRCGDSDSI